ncbi:MAG: hypothetical protein WAM39_26205 [Bryobacteraceae bacterium]
MIDARSKSKAKSAPKRVLRLPDLDHAKLSVLNTLGSPDSQRAYRIAMDDFITWYCSEPRIAFNKTVVLRYRIQLEAKHLAPATINLRLAAVRRLATKLRMSDCSVRIWLLASAESRAPSAWVCGLGTG